MYTHLMTQTFGRKLILYASSKITDTFGRFNHIFESKNVRLAVYREPADIDENNIFYDFMSD